MPEQKKKKKKTIMRKEAGANDELFITEKKSPLSFSLCIVQYVCPSLSAVWSEGQLDRPGLFLSPLILCAVQFTGSQQKICTGNCKTQSCPDYKKFKCFQARPAVSQLSYPQLQLGIFPSSIHCKFCFLQE